ncbi:MAG TPA: hypothetical protein VGV09_06670 [Steroidobacteraceae bacterium]|nr:hypothetical protein [Steroidobacteraceae bacterium]
MNQALRIVTAVVGAAGATSARIDTAEAGIPDLAEAIARVRTPNDAVAFENTVLEPVVRRYLSAGQNASMRSDLNSNVLNEIQALVSAVPHEARGQDRPIVIHVDPKSIRDVAGFVAASRRRPEITALLGPPLLPFFHVEIRFKPAVSPRPPQQPASGRPPSKIAKPAKTWIAVQILDDRTGDPIADLKLKLAATDGVERSVTTGADGIVRVDNIDPGMCNVRCPLAGATLVNALRFMGTGAQSAGSSPTGAAGEPAAAPRVIVEVDEHRVSTGESLDSVAAAAGLTRQDLTRFNWGTTDSKEINQRLYDEVGCTKTTLDGKNYIFDDLDEPGVVYVPTEWKQEYLETTRTHVFTVAPIERFLIVLESEQGLRIPDAAYEVTLADQSVRTGWLGRSGIGVLRGVPAGAVSVVYTDFDDVAAKSMAASVHAAFARRKLPDLYRVLEHSAQIIGQVAAAYETYYNDRTGEGFVSDIYQEVTDPAALDAVVGLMARAGLPTRENAEFVAWRPEEID